MPTTTPTNALLSVDISYVKHVNLAMQQNGLPVVFELKLTNNTNDVLHDLECSFSSTPEIFVPKNITIAELKPQETLSLHDLNLELDYNFLLPISEAVNGKLTVSVAYQQQIAVTNDFPVTAYSADQWLGLSVMPELLAAFVTPNLQVITQLQTVVAEEMAKATGSPAIKGYLADKEHVYEICKAIYRAIHSWGINYSIYPASFGTPGQRIRFADTICQFHTGTCLDTTLLFASVMENCGLHPVIMLQKRHAYIGCHLKDRYFPDIPMDDLQAIRKLVELDEFIVIETTCVTGHQTFASAEATAKKENLNLDDEFECAIDIIRARYSGIRPLPLKRSVNGMEFVPAEQNVTPLGQEGKRNLQQEIDLSQLTDASARSGRIEHWKQKLLDLSLRNRLLNVRDSSASITLACPNIAILEDQIAANEVFTLNPLSNLLTEKDLHDLNLLRTSEVKPELLSILEKEFNQKRLWTLQGPNELQRRLSALHRQSRSDLEEGGVNTLFLALGFLEWKQSPRDQRSYLAPILLVPLRMQRRSIVEGFSISRLDEDTVINETLLELLSSQFQLTIPGISPLPTDDNGINVPMVMQIFRQTIKDMQGWEVREEARVGHFSFGKYIMWHDMDTRLEEMQKNPLVHHLITGGGLYDDGIEVFPQEELEEHLKLESLFCPLSADSSQLTAVLYSALGKSFVLHGPPGTGKSQTITNIIAHNLALGRRVLFVSEKKAALDVVHNRLKSIGLQPFCLELHSNKSGKSEVLEQFSEALEVPASANPADWPTTVQALERLRTELNGFVAELHHQYPNGLTAYDCFSRSLGKHSKEVPDIRFEVDYLQQTKDEYEISRSLVADLANAWQGTSPDAVTNLTAVNTFAWSPVYEQQLLQKAKALKNSSEQLQKAYLEIAPLLALPATDRVPIIYRAATLFEAIKKSGDIPAALLTGDFSAHTDFLQKYSQNALRLIDLRQKLKSYNLDKFADVDFPGLVSRIKQIKEAFFLFRLVKTRALLKELSPLKKQGGTKLSLAELEALLPEAEAYLEASAGYQQGKAKASELLGKLWDEERTDWSALQPLLDRCQTVLATMQDFVKEAPDALPALQGKLQAVLPEASQLFKSDSHWHRQCNAFFLAWNAFQNDLEPFALFAECLQNEPSLNNLQDTLATIISHSGELRGVLRYRTVAEKVVKCGLGELVASLADKRIEATELTEVYETILYRNMLNQILSSSPVLCQFSGINQNQRIQDFCALDARYTKLAQQIIFARLAAKLPRKRSDNCPAGSELGMLQRECQKRARQKPVRQLLEQLPTLTPVLKPCFLMSPMSVAQYLPPDTMPFDLIVFDEASQIPVWDAIGVIARGRQVIIVGDPKQMPPTNFFQKGDANDNDMPVDETEDLESILDECLAAGLFSSHLNWHYRSRHEDLISFSNHYYYGDRLFTFPSAQQNERLGIRFHFVPDGSYDRKSTRTNRKEAEALVDYIFQQLESSGGHPRSFGIVTFSQAQRDLIEDLLEEQRTKHPQLESYFNPENPDTPAPFVKNLENVQGDERDVIFFSIGYATDAEGKFSMNFGPLNRQGGERRLNVAITRAREQVVVFSSIHAQQIELSRTNAVGARHLRDFLEYAENGHHLHFASENSGGTSEEICQVIADFLAEHGYVTDFKVGSSGYQIDLGVCTPDRPDEYLLGIECDGKNYASQHTTRDREGLRAEVLRKLGWHIYRAWCVDWTFDRPRCERELLELLEKLKNTPADSHGQITPDEPPAEDIPAVEVPPALPETIPCKPKNYYLVWQPQEQLPTEYIYDKANLTRIRKQILQVIQTEGPIYEKLLKKRILHAWGLTRISDSFKNVFEQCLPRNAITTTLGEDLVFWPNGISPQDYRDYRISPDEDSRRAIDEIPPEEIANAMQEVLTDLSSCEKDTLLRETLKLFGLSVVTNKARKYLEYGLQALQNSGRI